MYRSAKKKIVRQASISAVVVLGAIATGVGVANAATHTAKATHPAAITSTRMGRSTGTSTMPAGCPGAAGGDVTALTSTSVTVQDRSGTSTTYSTDSSTTVTKDRQASTLASLALGDNVRLTVSGSDTTLATAIDIEPATLAGQVTAVSGDVITVTGPDGATGTVDVSGSTTYSKARATATLSDVTIGSLVFAEGNFASNSTTLDAATVGIGQPGGPGQFDGPGPLGVPGGPGPAGPGTPDANVGS